LVRRGHTICGPNSIITDAAGLMTVSERAACTVVSVAGVVGNHVHVIHSLCIITISRSLMRALPGIAVSQFGHEVSIKHGLPHLLLLLSLGQFVRIMVSIEADSSLVEHVLFLLHLVHIWKHFMDS